MAKITTRDVDDYAEDDFEELEEEIVEDEDELEPQAVMSDSRARRKRNRGELVETTATTEKKGRATPRRDQAVTKSVPFIQRIPVVSGLINYLRASVAEMRKVTWPTREETIHLTRLVLAVTVVFSLSLGLLDVFFGWWFRQALSDETLFLLIAAGVTIVGGAFSWFAIFQQEDSAF